MRTEFQISSAVPAAEIPERADTQTADLFQQQVHSENRSVGTAATSFKYLLLCAQPPHTSFYHLNYWVLMISHTSLTPKAGRGQQQHRELWV